MATLTRDDLLTVLSVMNAKGHFDYVRKARMWLGLVFSWGIEHRHCQNNPATSIDPEKAFGKRKVESFAAVEVHEVPALMKRLALENQALQSMLACLRLSRGAPGTHAEDGGWNVPGAGRAPSPREGGDAAGLRSTLFRPDRQPLLGPYAWRRWLTRTAARSPRASSERVAGVGTTSGTAAISTLWMLKLTE